MIETEYARFGLYCVDGLTFINKGDALTVASATNKPVTWNFNDEIYSLFDWSIPIQTTLTELYKQRAQQIRDKYDYVSLFFSGGVDSANVLHAFLDNDILLDEVVMFRPFSQVNVANKIDRTPRNLYSEIEFAALPHLRQYIKDPRTLVRCIDMEDSTEKFLNNDNLLSQFNRVSCFGAASVARAGASFTDPHWRKLYEAGKSVAHIQGVDKPVIQYVDGRYIFNFDESATISSQFDPTSRSAESEMLKKHHHHEFFYWTPDLPELVIKQCQVVKKLCEDDMVFKFLFANKQLTAQDKIMPLIHQVYPPHVNAIRNLFCTAKQSGAGLLASHHQWIYDYTTPETIGKFKDVISNLQNTIDDRFFVSASDWFHDDVIDPRKKMTAKKFQYKFYKSKSYLL